MVDEGAFAKTAARVASEIPSISDSEPKMTPAQAKRLPQVLGDGYFAATILAAAGEAIRGVGVDVPFSSLAYGLLNT